MPHRQERRTPERHQLSLKLAVIDKLNKRPVGQIVNLSEHGALLECTSELAPNHAYDLEALLFFNDGTLSKLPISAVPIWSQQDGDARHYYCGVKFNEGPSSSNAHTIIEEMALEPPKRMRFRH